LHQGVRVEGFTPGGLPQLSPAWGANTRNEVFAVIIGQLRKSHLDQCPALPLVEAFGVNFDFFGSFAEWATFINKHFILPKKELSNCYAFILPGICYLSRELINFLLSWLNQKFRF
jgi:hypothetical protein